MLDISSKIDIGLHIEESDTISEKSINLAMSKNFSSLLSFPSIDI